MASAPKQSLSISILHYWDLVRNLQTRGTEIAAATLQQSSISPHHVINNSSAERGTVRAQSLSAVYSVFSLARTGLKAWAEKPITDFACCCCLVTTGMCLLILCRSEEEEREGATVNSKKRYHPGQDHHVGARDRLAQYSPIEIGLQFACRPNEQRNRWVC